MARYPYSPELKPPGSWTGIDFSDQKLAPAVRMMCTTLRNETRSIEVPEGVRMHIEKVSVWDESVIECLVFTPEEVCVSGASDRKILYCHGGGFFLPIQPMMAELAAQYAGELQTEVWLPEYRILPDYPSPYPFRDCLSILNLLTDAGSQVLLYGESAGGALAAGLALWARDHERDVILGQLLAYPVLDNRFSRYPSMRLYSEAAWPLKNHLTMWREYLRNGKDEPDAYLIPMSAPDLSDLMPTYVEPQEIDTLRDEAVAFAGRLKEAGNQVTLRIVPGSYHGFDSDTAGSFVQNIVRERIEWMRSVLT